MEKSSIVRDTTGENFVERKVASSNLKGLLDDFSSPSCDSGPGPPRTSRSVSRGGGPGPRGGTLRSPISFRGGGVSVPTSL